jgi:hypothetical protein
MITKKDLDEIYNEKDEKRLIRKRKIERETERQKIIQQLISDLEERIIVNIDDIYPIATRKLCGLIKKGIHDKLKKSNLEIGKIRFNQALQKAIGERFYSEYTFYEITMVQLDVYFLETMEKRVDEFIMALKL